MANKFQIAVLLLCAASQRSLVWKLEFQREKLERLGAAQLLDGKVQG